MLLILGLLTVLLLFGIGITELFAFGPLHVLHLLKVPQWLILFGIISCLAWLMGDD